MTKEKLKKRIELLEIKVFGEVYKEPVIAEEAEDAVEEVSPKAEAE
jgi:hypothetical protein